MQDSPGVAVQCHKDEQKATEELEQGEITLTVSENKDEIEAKEKKVNEKKIKKELNAKIYEY